MALLFSMILFQIIFIDMWFMFGAVFHDAFEVRDGRIRLIKEGRRIRDLRRTLDAKK